MPRRVQSLQGGRSGLGLLMMPSTDELSVPAPPVAIRRARSAMTPGMDAPMDDHLLTGSLLIPSLDSPPPIGRVSLKPRDTRTTTSLLDSSDDDDDDDDGFDMELAALSLRRSATMTMVPPLFPSNTPPAASSSQLPSPPRMINDTNSMRSTFHLPAVAPLVPRCLLFDRSVSDEMNLPRPQARPKQQRHQSWIPGRDYLVHSKENKKPRLHYTV